MKTLLGITMSFKLLITYISLLFVTACSPRLTVLGTIDESLMITHEDIHKMGFEKFKQNYLGKEITIADLKPLGKSGGYRPEKGQCLIAYRNTAEYRDYPILVDIYANHFPNHVLKSGFMNGSYTDESIRYDDEISLPMDVCSPCLGKWNPETKECFSASPNTVITGKVITVSYLKDTGMISFAIKPKGIAF